MASSIIFACLAGCAGAGQEEAPSLDPIAANAAVTDARRYLGEGSEVLAVCGPSVGESFYLDQYQEGFATDGIDNGVIIFARASDGSPEILNRDAFQELIVASEDGGQISRPPESDESGLGIWVVQFPSTGVVESHNLATAEDGTLIDVWTANKPGLGILPARSSIFHSKCEIRT